MTSPLELNPFRTENGIHYLDADGGAFEYSDGKEAESYLNQVLSDASDLGSSSSELEDKVIDWPSEYHLSGKRANLLREYNWDGVNRVLELGCGCGALTRFLGEQGMSVDAVEGSQQRIQLAAKRCRDLKDIQFLCANFNDLELPQKEYDAILLVGVAEYAARFMASAVSGAEAVVALLQRLRRSLKEDGFVFIAIENRTGLKYVLGAHEDHYARRFAGVFNYPDEHGMRTYTKNDWEQFLSQAGYSSPEFSYPFPDYKVPTVILSDHMVKHDKYSFNHIEGMRSRDYVMSLPEGFYVTEHLLWQALSENNNVDALANSFCIVAHNATEVARSVTQFDFVHLPGFRRRAEFNVITRKDIGSDTVTRRHVFPDLKRALSSVRQTVRNEHYLSGTLLSVQWSRAALLQDNGHMFDDMLREYFGFLIAEHNAGRLYIDLLPTNILVSDDGEFHVFDQEWEVDWPLTPRFVFFRALVAFAQRHRVEIARITRGRGIFNIREFVVCGFDTVDRHRLEARPLRGLVEQENMFQGLIARDERTDRTSDALDMQLTVLDVNEPIQSHVYWSFRKRSYSEEASVMVEYIPADERQTLIFQLPEATEQFVRFRFDPTEEYRNDSTAFFNIYKIAVRYGSDFRSSEIVWHMEGEDRVAEAADKLSGMAFCDAEIGRVFAVLNEDPWMDFAFIPRRKLVAGERTYITVTLRAKRSAEYLLAQDRFLKREDYYGRRLEALEARLEDKELIEAELARIKSSQVWRLAHFFRRHVYHRGARVLRGLKRRLTEYRQLGWRLGVRRFTDTVEHYWRRLRRLPVTPIGPPSIYEQWLLRYRQEQAALNVALDGEPPLISVLMPVFNVDPQILDRAVQSVLAQTYDNWELCIADDCSTKKATKDYLARLNDPRIKVQFLDKNVNISAATNAAAAQAGGSYYAFMDNDDELERSALYDMAVAVQGSGADLLYSDEDFIGPDGHLQLPHFKPDYSPDLLLAHNYITHLVVIKRELFERIGGFRSQYDGAQDYDLLLRAVEQAERIQHVAKPLYHWRMSEQSTSLDPTVKPHASRNALAALQDCLQRRRIDAVVEETEQAHFFRVRRRINGDPLVSIIVPFKDKPVLLKSCLDSIVTKSTYQNYEFIGVSNDSVAPSVFDTLHEYTRRDRRFQLVQYNIEFNFSKIVNYGVAQSKGDYVLLLNNDIEIVSPEWIEAMLEHAQREEVAAVGGKLLYPNNTIQHAGIMIGLGGYAGHVHKRFPAFSPGYFNRLNIVQNVSAVTGAMMMVKRSLFEQFGGFDEEMFAIAYNDVDFCLRARERDMLNIFTPYALAYHHESVSRGYEDTEAKRKRFAREMNNLRERHGPALSNGDPYYNPNFDQDSDNFSLRPITP